jgi:hypothetical protein
VSLVVRWPNEVAANRYERLGNVGPSTEENIRSLIAKFCARS